jgi:Aspartyl protease
MPIVNGFLLPSNGANAELPAAKFDVYAFDPLTRATSSLPIGRNIVALFDTGAGSTVINSNRVDVTGMTPIGSATFSGASAAGTAPLFWIQLRFANPMFRVNVRATAIQMPDGTPYAALLGMDFIRNGRLMIDVRRGVVKLDGW